MTLSGIVYLVGAGPGDAGLFTRRGVEVLRRAEVVIYDGLVNRELLRYAPPNAEIIYGGKRANQQQKENQDPRRQIFPARGPGAQQPDDRGCTG